MPELKFACPGCGQHISCDELWGGHTIQCPACKQDLRVPLPPAAAPPAATAPRPSSLVPQPPAAPGKLSIGRPQAAASSAPAPSSPPPTPLRRHPAPSSKASSGLMKVVKIAAVVVGVVVGGYFGFTLVSNWQEKANAKRREVEKNSDGGELGHIANLYNVLDATEPGGRGLGGGTRGSGPRQRQTTAPRAISVPGEETDATSPGAPAGKQLPVIPAVWTLDLAAAKIPEGRANGTISGASFVPEAARLDQTAQAQVLRLSHGSPAAPDQEVLLYLHLKAGEKLSGHSWSVDKDMKGTDVPQLVKRWKPDPKYGSQSKTFFNGYAMKLELGQVNEGSISGKIFLALPDPEKSVVAGQFTAATSIAEAGAAPAPTPASVPDAASAAQRDAFEKRYGIKK